MVETSSSMRIACVGDSVTWGAFLLHRKRDCYPAVLQRLVGETVTVGNFGMIGHTLQSSGDFPYEISRPYRNSGEFAPDLVLIMLGTNDSKPKNWKGAEPFIEHYRNLIEHYRSLPSAPKVYLMTLPAVYGRGRSNRVRYGMSADAVLQMCDAIRSLASDEGLGLIDAHKATSNRPDVFRFDGVHPGAAGAELIAQAAYEALAPDLAGAPVPRACQHIDAGESAMPHH